MPPHPSMHPSTYPSIQPCPHATIPLLPPEGPDATLPSMHLMNRLPVLVLLLAVVTVYAAAGLLVLRAVRRRFSKGPPPPSRAEKWARRVFLALAALGVLCLAYGYFIEPYWLEVTHVRLAASKLPRGTRPVRIVLISDLHSDPSPRLEERLPDVVAAQEPDLIFFTGDCANSPEGLPVFRQCLKRVAEIAPTFAVRGNWDIGPPALRQALAGTGARELNDELVSLTVHGACLWIAGAAPEREPDLGRLLSRVPPGAFTVLLYHYPDAALEAAEHGIDLYCCGHTHGGQVALPFYGALITMSRFGKRFEAGLYRVGDTWLYVNRGIGMMGGAAPRVRFCSRPEVTVIDLVPGE